MRFHRVSALAFVLLSLRQVSAFQPPNKLCLRASRLVGARRIPPPLHMAADDSSDVEVDLGALKAELTAYLAKRKEVNADEAAKEQVGKVVGGTKGECVSKMS